MSIISQNADPVPMTEEQKFFFDLKAVFDEDTKLVSLKDFVKPELMFNDDYAYNTSLSTPMVEHFNNTAEQPVVVQT